MSLKKTLDDYLKAKEKHKTAKHELGEAEVRLEMACRKMSNCSEKLIDGNLKKLAIILTGKL